MNIKNWIDILIGIWHLPQRVSALENKLQTTTSVSNNQINNFGSFYMVGQPSNGPDKLISSTTVDRVEIISQEELEALPLKDDDDKTIYITM